ncbi:hypothetical protein [Saccharopolyspora gloriosae]|uniref:Uncharacterized protein n=1 Tax=Saccharopolyspora gloriosae TaxID=455344 RepID=A0A840NL95_9PSEU|nr:hypothetical protein [Saccharopolyspora gloriosae]MBB5072344.1 hypothetical protein [Saccharopolyspora gloriosae]
METWRIVAIALTLVIGTLLIMDSVGKIRGERARRRTRRLRTGVRGVVLLAASTALVATVLPATAVWALLVGTALIMSVRFVID